MICGLTTLTFFFCFFFKFFRGKFRSFLANNFTIKMLFYNLITSKEGKDDSEGDDAPYDSSLISKQCIICRYFYYTSKNFNNDHKKGNICDGCFHCIVYENENPHLIFRIVTLKNGTFRTVSNYFLSEIEKILENLNITLARDFGWIYKKKLECESND